jgi:hypothetical protein
VPGPAGAMARPLFYPFSCEKDVKVTDAGGGLEASRRDATSAGQWANAIGRRMGQAGSGNDESGATRGTTWNGCHDEREDGWVGRMQFYRLAPVTWRLPGTSTAGAPARSAP